MAAALLFAVAPLLVCAIAIGRVLLARAAEAHQRGALVHVPRGMRNASRARRPSGAKESRLRLGGISFEPEEEARHFKFIGTTGTGKSTAIAQLLRGALERGDRAVITDPNGAYLERFFDRYRGDIVLSPFEPRAVRWDLFAEARRPYDYDDLARCLIAEGDDRASREWRSYARTFVAAVARRCGETGTREIGALWRLLAMADARELRRYVEGTPAQPFLEPDNARMFGSLRSVAVAALAALQHIEAQRGRSLSVRDWVAAGRGVLFLPYRAAQIAALRTLIATWARLAIFETLSGDDRGPGASAAAARRLWFIVDELDALGAIDGLRDALARLRKFGGRCVLGFQSIAQVSSLYGPGDSQTIIENCGNTLILRCSASEGGGTSAFASRLIGEREIVRTQRSRGREAGELFSGRGRRRSMQVTQHRVTEAAVLASEIEQLPDLTGYLKTARSPRWTLIRVAPDARPWPSTTSA